MSKPKKAEKEMEPGKRKQTRNHEQVSMTADPRILAEIGRFAKLAGMSRSMFIVLAAQKEIERMRKQGIGVEKDGEA